VLCQEGPDRLAVQYDERQLGHLSRAEPKPLHRIVLPCDGDDEMLAPRETGGNETADQA
jgi:hypothetical protein